MLCLLILCIEAAGAVSLTCLSESEVHLKTPTLEPSVSLCLLMLEFKMNAKKKKKSLSTQRVVGGNGIVLIT